MFPLSSFLPRHVFLSGLSEADTVTGDALDSDFFSGHDAPSQAAQSDPRKPDFLSRGGKSPIS